MLLKSIFVHQTSPHVPPRCWTTSTSSASSPWAFRLRTWWTICGSWSTTQPFRMSLGWPWLCSWGFTNAFKPKKQLKFNSNLGQSEETSFWWELIQLPRIGMSIEVDRTLKRSAGYVHRGEPVRLRHACASSCALGTLPGALLRWHARIVAGREKKCEKITKLLNLKHLQLSSEIELRVMIFRPVDCRFGFFFWISRSDSGENIVLQDVWTPSLDLFLFSDGVFLTEVIAQLAHPVFLLLLEPGLPSQTVAVIWPSHIL